jgi:branched-chain amino acid transport system ATP-binding protein
VIGPNGAGKTTFFNCITGYYKPEFGNILFLEKEIRVTTNRIAEEGISRTYQNIAFSTADVIENILAGEHTTLHSSLADSLFASKRYRTEETETVRKAKEILAFVFLSGCGDQLACIWLMVHTSPGNCRAIANSPKVLLLDEPTAGMNHPKRSK